VELPDLRNLRERRAALRLLTQTITSLETLGHLPMAAELHAEARALRFMKVGVVVPCLVRWKCSGTFTVFCEVGGDLEPSAGICGPCSAAVNADVLRERDGG
jgi:hypothetical protein